MYREFSCNCGSTVERFDMLFKKFPLKNPEFRDIQ